jgi:hypothetical protein
VREYLDHNSRRKQFIFDSPMALLPLAAILLAVIASVVALNIQGRVWWCQQGDYVPWSWLTYSAHNSQHFIDPYTFTHILHGVLEFWILGLIFKKMPLAWRLAIAVGIECTWEVAENTNTVIERYRAVTISLDYFGDSIINSLADILSCAAGFLIAYKLKFWRSLVFFLLTEIILIFWIRDSLLINIIMLIYPIEGIKAWQTGG